MGQDGEDGRKVSGGVRERFCEHGQARKSGRREGPKRPQAGQGPGVFRTVQPQWDETRRGEEAVVRIRANRGLRSESGRYLRAGPV